MNLPNRLTLIRIGAAFIFMIFLFADNLYAKYLALFVFTGAVLTDIYDGRLARRKGVVTNFGKLMDPLADKILIVSAFVSFVGLGYIPSWTVIIIISREFAITGLRLLAASQGEVLAAEKGGKHKTASQMFAIFTILIFICLRRTTIHFFDFWTESADKWFQFFLPYLMYITVILTVISGSLYLYRNRHIILRG
ncbi:CDP-diacylglycerol--glycerol-3-phosphate 3-phosphatidyltransferase [candidate division NPL-UPA2 bacterium]|nr:CDP-diacylglycerol--glycerol-3-phosphate 3-phosphatidyltransferase [candidate division NPL-UPA2 bacterium]